MRQPDIEIYLKDVEQQAIHAWLTAALGPCSDWQQRGQTFKCQAAGIPITWLPKAVGRWSSLLLESPETPWADDLACARAAHAALHVQIRCAIGGWEEDEDTEEADRWIKVDQDGESEIIWRTD